MPVSLPALYIPRIPRINVTKIPVISIHTGHIGAVPRFPLIPASRHTPMDNSLITDIIFDAISKICSLFFLCHLNRIIPPLWKSLTEHQKCQDQQPQNRLQKKATLLPIPVRDPMRIKMDWHPLRQISPTVATRYITYPTDHQKTRAHL